MNNHQHQQEQNLTITTDYAGKESSLIDFFTQTFADSEGENEGRIIGQLVSDLLDSTEEENLYGFLAYCGSQLVGSIFFSRISYDQDDRTVFILSPVAIATDRQRQGIGQKLIRHGLSVIKQNHVAIALTYGDPAYYCKVGFKPISEQIAKPPFKLSYPHGWLGQSLTAQEITPLKGVPHCVAALQHSEYW